LLVLNGRKKGKIYMLSGKFENCYGLKSFELKEIDFTTSNKSIIYAPNGVMKTSFSNVFDDISKGNKTTDRIFNGLNSSYIVKYYSSTYTNSQLSKKDNIYVVKSFDEKFELSKETISTLLSDEKTRKDYEILVSQFSDELSEFKSNLSKLSGFAQKDIEEKLKNDFKISKKSDWSDIFSKINEIFSTTENIELFNNIKYTDLVNEKTETIITSPNFLNLIDSYIDLLNKLISDNEILSKNFSDYNAEELGKSLKKHDLFRNNHKIVLQNGREIKSASEWTNAINEQLDKIYSNPEIGKSLQDLKKKLVGNDSVRTLREIILANKEIIVYFNDIEKLKTLLWVNYLNNLEKDFSAYFSKINSYSKQIKSLYESAEKQAERWQKVVNEFNRRFKVPFEVKISNKANFLLKDEAPNLYFTYTRCKGTPEEENADFGKDELMKSLSMGEKRAMYLLYILFDIEIIKEKAVQGSGKHLIIVDDIADSFDYKNKYAIIEYLADISKNQYIDLLILTHNFDFYRTVVSRVGIPREKCYIVQKSENAELEMTNFGYLKDYFLKGIVKTIKDGNINTTSKKIKLLSSIPFYRNLTEYMLLSTEFLNLTCLLHLKSTPFDTTKLKLSNVWNMIPNNLKIGFNNTFSTDKDENYLDLLRNIAKEICNSSTEEIVLENKIILSMAIRLELEKFLKPILVANNISLECKDVQTRCWSESAKPFLTIEQIKIVDEVNLITPESIHINSFMYEPIIDMSDWMLKELYKNVLHLNGLTI
jgi:hypothetical protein